MSKYCRQQRRREQVQQPRQNHDQSRHRAFLVAHFMGPTDPGAVRLTLNAPGYLRWDIAFIWRQGSYLSKAAQSWLALLRERPVSPEER